MKSMILPSMVNALKQPTNDDEVHKMINESTSKSGILDPLPTDILKKEVLILFSTG